MQQLTQLKNCVFTLPLARFPTYDTNACDCFQVDLISDKEFALKPHVINKLFTKNTQYIRAVVVGVLPFRASGYNKS